MIEGKNVFRDVQTIAVRGDLPHSFAQLTCDSRKVQPGGLFVALRGTTFDGHRFLSDAQRLGALGAVVEEWCDVSLPQIKVYDTLASLPKIAANFYRHPAQSLHLTGITGSNGKTTSTYLLETLLQSVNKPCGVIGTIEYRYGNHKIPAANTTPFPHELQYHFRQMADEGMGHAVMEVSSHGLSLHRVDEVLFDVAVFTNLSQDHLDFHHTMEEYREAKRLLFTRYLKPNGKAIINMDDETGRLFARDIPQDQLITYGIELPADVYATEIETTLTGNSFVLHLPNGSAHVNTPFIGKHNVYNVLGVCAAAYAQGLTLDEIKHGISQFQAVPGRLERVETTIGAQVVVDYCHTPDALEKCLETLDAIPHKRLITLFGCGGDRDPIKRPLMAKAAERWSGVVIVTSDNPRTENPAKIIADIMAGLTGSAKTIEVIEDRRQAIQYACGLLEEGDLLLLAGKGHEDYMIIGKEKHPFDDRIIAKDYLRQMGKA